MSGDEGVRVRWWMVRGCGNVRLGVVSGGLDAMRARVCMFVCVCGMSMCGLLVCACVRMVWGGVACGKGVRGSAHVRVHCIGRAWL